MVWGLDTEPGEHTFVLPAESASPASFLLQKAADCSRSVSSAQPKPPESTAPTPIQAEPLAYGSYTDTKHSVNYVQAIPRCLQLSFLGANLSLLWASKGSTCSTPPRSPRPAFCKHPLFVLSCSFWESESLSTAGKRNILKSDSYDVPATATLFTAICSAL